MESINYTIRTHVLSFLIWSVDQTIDQTKLDHLSKLPESSRALGTLYNNF